MLKVVLNTITVTPKSNVKNEYQVYNKYVIYTRTSLHLVSGDCVSFSLLFVDILIESTYDVIWSL